MYDIKAEITLIATQEGGTGLFFPLIGVGKSTLLKLLSRILQPQLRVQSSWMGKQFTAKQHRWWLKNWLSCRNTNVLGAVLTPSTDPLTQSLLAGAVLGLYFGGIGMVKLLGK